MRTSDSGAPAPEDGVDPPADDLDPDFLEDEPLDQSEPEESEFEPDGQPEPEPRQRQPGRAARRIEALTQRTRELEERLRATEGRQALPDPTAAQAAAAHEEQQFRASLVGLMPEEIALKVAERTERKIQAQVAQVELRGFDRSDKAQYEAMAARDRFAQSKAQEVETYLAGMRNQGIYQFGRMDVLDFLRGRELRLRAEKAGQQQRRDGARRVERETVRPGSARGTAGGGGRRTSEEEADRALLQRTTTRDALGM